MLTHQNYNKSSEERDQDLKPKKNEDATFKKKKKKRQAEKGHASIPIGAYENRVVK